MLQVILVASCKKCRGRFRFRLRNRGKTVRCPHCGVLARLPIRAARDDTEGDTRARR
jgi:RNase P subunit RPR2